MASVAKTPFHFVLRAVAACLVAASLTLSSRADAGVIEDVVPLFAADSYSDTSAAIEKLIAANPSNAQAILEALADRRLEVDGKAGVLVYKQGAETIDAATGKAVASPPAAAQQVRVNNRVRSQIEAALGSLALTGKDPEKRRLAVEALAKAKNPADLPRIEAALKTETDAKVKDALTVARAGIVISAPNANPTDQMQAISVLSARSDSETLGILRQAAQGLHHIGTQRE